MADGAVPNALARTTCTRTMAIRPARVDEIADGIIRISSYYPDAVLGRGVTVNQFLVLAEEPLLFHTGLRTAFPATQAALARILPP
jgi:hypothetical protein